MTETTKTTCPYCGVGCGLLVTPRPDGGADVVGDPEHAANRGHLCPKGAALGETLAVDNRLLRPGIADRDRDWEQPLDQVAERFATVLADHGPEAIAFYVSGHLLTEDYYVANKLMKGFLGSGNIDTNGQGTRADAGPGPPPAARPRLRARSARLPGAAVSLAGNGAAPLVWRWHAAPQMHAPAPRNARACTAPTPVSPAVGR